MVATSPREVSTSFSTPGPAPPERADRRPGASHSSSKRTWPPLDPRLCRLSPFAPWSSPPRLNSPATVASRLAPARLLLHHGLSARAERPSPKRRDAHPNPLIVAFDYSTGACAVSVRRSTPPTPDLVRTPSLPRARFTLPLLNPFTTIAAATRRAPGESTRHSTPILTARGASTSHLPEPPRTTPASATRAQPPRRLQPRLPTRPPAGAWESRRIVFAPAGRARSSDSRPLARN